MDNEEFDRIVDGAYNTARDDPTTATLIMLEVISKLLIEMRDELKNWKVNNGLS